MRKVRTMQWHQLLQKAFFDARDFGGGGPWAVTWPCELWIFLLAGQQVVQPPRRE